MRIVNHLIHAVKVFTGKAVWHGARECANWRTEGAALKRPGGLVRVGLHGPCGPYPATSGNGINDLHLYVINHQNTFFQQLLIVAVANDLFPYSAYVALIRNQRSKQSISVLSLHDLKHRGELTLCMLVA